MFSSTTVNIFTWVSTALSSLCKENKNSRTVLRRKKPFWPCQRYRLPKLCMLGSRGVGRTNRNVSKENMKSGTYLEHRPRQGLSEKAVNHYREFTDLEGNSVGSLWIWLAIRKLCETFLHRDIELASCSLWVRKFSPGSFIQEPSWTGFPIMCVARFLRSCYFLDHAEHHISIS